MAIKIHTEADAAQKVDPGKPTNRLWTAVSGEGSATGKDTAALRGAIEARQSKAQEPIIVDREPIDAFANEIVQSILRKNEERLAYNAAYQRDLRTIKRLGLEITVAAYRKSKET